MADNKPIVRVKAGVLPGVREYNKTDFTQKAADIEAAEETRAQNIGDGAQMDAQAAGIAEALDAQENGGVGGEKLDENAISDTPQWYVAHTYSGYENKVKTNIDLAVVNRHMEDQIFEVAIPMEDVVEIKDGKPETKKHKLFPGYVLINMIMNDEAWYVVRNTTGVTGFIGGSEPLPLSEAEMKALGMSSATTVQAAGNTVIKVDYAVGDSVAIIAGAWKDTLGTVSKIDYKRQVATIIVELFGREIPVEIGFGEVRKAN